MTNLNVHAELQGGVERQHLDLMEVVGAVGHVVAQAVGVVVEQLRTPFSPVSSKAFESVEHATVARRHELNHIYMDLPNSWGSTRRT